MPSRCRRPTGPGRRRTRRASSSDRGRRVGALGDVAAVVVGGGDPGEQQRLLGRVPRPSAPPGRRSRAPRRRRPRRPWTSPSRQADSGSSRSAPPAARVNAAVAARQSPRTMYASPQARSRRGGAHGLGERRRRLGDRPRRPGEDEHRPVPVEERRRAPPGEPASASCASASSKRSFASSHAAARRWSSDVSPAVRTSRAFAYSRIRPWRTYQPGSPGSGWRNSPRRASPSSTWVASSMPAASSSGPENRSKCDGPARARAGSAPTPGRRPPRRDTRTAGPRGAGAARGPPPGRLPGPRGGPRSSGGPRRASRRSRVKIRVAAIDGRLARDRRRPAAASSTSVSISGTVNASAAPPRSDTSPWARSRSTPNGGSLRETRSTWRLRGREPDQRLDEPPRAGGAVDLVAVVEDEQQVVVEDVLERVGDERRGRLAAVLRLGVVARIDRRRDRRREVLGERLELAMERGDDARRERAEVDVGGVDRVPGGGTAPRGAGGQRALSEAGPGDDDREPPVGAGGDPAPRGRRARGSRWDRAAGPAWRRDRGRPDAGVRRPRPAVHGRPLAPPLASRAHGNGSPAPLRTGRARWASCCRARWTSTHPAWSRRSSTRARCHPDPRARSCGPPARLARFRRRSVCRR